MESIKALFTEKEKELVVAVQKVDILTRQLEELRKGRIHGLATDKPNHKPSNQSSLAELERLRQEIMVSSQTVVFRMRQKRLAPKFAYLPTYLSTQILPIYLPTYPPTYQPTYPPTYLPTYLPTHPPTYLPPSLPTSTFLPSC